MRQSKKNLYKYINICRYDKMSEKDRTFRDRKCKECNCFAGKTKKIRNEIYKRCTSHKSYMWDEAQACSAFRGA